ncbi:hypothetical protein BKA82DRAFT_4020487 [Pisolithus tinctorius]|nr:hypothetical protein BKA82DRAFT_4020487 [Pisolithus tinctorius]
MALLMRIKQAPGTYDPTDGLIHHSYLDAINLVYKGLQVNKEHLAVPHFARVMFPFKDLKVHPSECHKDTPTPKFWPACKMQQLSRGGPGHALFPDHDSTTPIPSIPIHDTIIHLGQEMKEVSTSGMQQDELPLKEGISNTPFHHHQNEDTMDTYSAPVIALLYMLGQVQWENRYSLLFLIAKVTALGPAIKEGVDVSASLHQVLTEVWMTKWPKTTGNAMPCPTKQTLALYTLEGDGKHKEPAAMELLYKGHRIHLKQLCSMFADSATTIVSLWENKVLWQVKICVPYESLAYDLGNHDMGYSFLTDRSNACFDNCDALSNKFLSDPSLAGQFGAQRDGRMIWDKGALQKWLDNYAEYQGQLLLC